MARKAPALPQTQEPCGLREQKKRQTSRDLHRAALHLVHEETLEAATISRIAELAGVSQRTFFNYFPTKEAAILGIPNDIDKRVIAAFAARPAGEDVWISILHVVMGIFDRDPENQDIAHAVYARYPEIAKGLLDAALKSRHTGIEAVKKRLIAQRIEEDAAEDRAHELIELGNATVATAAHMARSKKISQQDALDFVQSILAETVTR